MKSKNEDKLCVYCRFASEIPDTEEMLCDKCGVVPKEYSCRKYVYDPLKRVPREREKLSLPDEFPII